MASSHTSNKVRLCGVLITLLTEVSVKASSDQSPVHGTSPDPVDFSFGNNSYDVSFACTREEWELKAKPAIMRENAVLKRARGSLHWSVQEPGSPQSNREARFGGVKDVEYSSSEGSADAQQVKVSLSVMTVLEDGRPLMGA